MGHNTLAAQVHAEPRDVNARLAELELEEGILLRAAQRGWVAFASCTRNHPPAIPGIWAWGETICSLGEQLIPHGWERINESMWPLIVNRAGTVALSVATGNENTGNKDEDPLTSSAKGPKTVNAIFANRRQLIDPRMLLGPLEPIETAGRSTWLYLVHRDITARQMRSELSRPISMDEDGRVDGWAERIILAPQELDGIPESLVGGTDGPQTPEITVEIRRRA
ncbi:MAG TPA: hypothetical protein VN442_01120 [Bryobacteraceae bacterium]|nr:hypothetical protein [Bryobacteraceae bacterium]